MAWYKRGARVKTGWRVGHWMSAHKNQSFTGFALRLAGVDLLPVDETKHFKFVGTTGTGKSTAIAQLLRGALKRGDRAIFADPDGGYLARFHNVRGADVILNPFERRSVKWDPFAEIESPFDVEQL